jgi:hypothetical protein
VVSVTGLGFSPPCDKYLLTEIQVRTETAAGALSTQSAGTKK